MYVCAWVGNLCLSAAPVNNKNEKVLSKELNRELKHLSTSPISLRLKVHIWQPC